MGYAINSVGGWRWVDTSADVVAGETYSATVPVATPTLAQSAALASVSGLTIALTGSVTLTATLFPTDAVTQISLNALYSMAKDSVLPAWATTFDIQDATGTTHHFTAAQAQTVIKAISGYVYTLVQIAKGNPNAPTTLPSSSVTLTV